MRSSARERERDVFREMKHRLLSLYEIEGVSSLRKMSPPAKRERETRVSTKKPRENHISAENAAGVWYGVAYHIYVMIYYTILYIDTAKKKKRRRSLVKEKDHHVSRRT